MSFFSRSGTIASVAPDDRVVNMSVTEASNAKALYAPITVPSCGWKYSRYQWQ